MEIKAGQRLACPTGSTEVVVVRPPGTEVELTCAGEAVVDPASERTDTATSSDDDQVLVGKRYTDEESGIEVLCSKPGPGPLAVDGRPLTIKGAKPLPSSD
ncbi:MAG: hypothetical protein MUE36_02160 [Acidimicrobiales bacterium]|jgi:hypothetical protein|nr:hypothetical protein [Acidimicrobiales bacterium]